MMRWVALLAMACAPAAGGATEALAQSTGEQCATISDSAHRLVCYDGIFLFKTNAEEPSTTPPVSAWRVREDVSRIDDSKSVFLSTVALQPYDDDYGAKRQPILYVRCMENVTAMLIDFDGDFMSDTRYYGPVTLRVDDKPAVDFAMDASTDNKALGLWRGGSSIPAIKSLLGGHRLIVRAVPVNSSAVTVEFDITGLESAIDGVRKACAW